MQKLMNWKFKKKTLAGRISDEFIDGLIIIIPLAITALVVLELLKFTEVTIGHYLPVKFPGAGLLTIVFSVWAVGVLSELFLSKKILQLGEWFLDKIPVVKFIYSSVKKFSTAVFESDSLFQNVVLVPYNQSMTLGFLMNAMPEQIQKKLGDEYVCVFMPWSLNMTSGINLFVKKSELVFLDMRPEDALQFILTAGTASVKNGKEA